MLLVFASRTLQRCLHSRATSPTGLSRANSYRADVQRVHRLVARAEKAAAYLTSGLCYVLDDVSMNAAVCAHHVRKDTNCAWVVVKLYYAMIAIPCDLSPFPATCSSEMTRMTGSRIDLSSQPRYYGSRRCPILRFQYNVAL